jgi:hypothetical protein
VSRLDERGEMSRAKEEEKNADFTTQQDEKAFHLQALEEQVDVCVIASIAGSRSWRFQAYHVQMFTLNQFLFKTITKSL